MKTLSILMVGCFLFLCSTSSNAFVGEDNFDDNSIDLSKWSFFSSSGTSELRESSSVLQFRDPVGSSDGMNLLAWAQALPDDESWTAMIDVSIPFGLLDTSLDQEFYLTMGVANANDFTDSVSIDYTHSVFNNSEVASFGIYKQVDDSDVVAFHSPTSVSSASLMIQWSDLDSKFKIGYLAGGNAVILQEISVSDWNLRPDDPFMLGIGLGTEGNGLTFGWDDGVFEDNFKVSSTSSSVPEPTAVSLFLLGIGFFVRNLRKKNGCV